MSARFALILAGGRGTRFWPLSRRSRPKQCLALTGERSLLQETVDRVLPLVPAERVLVLTSPDMAGLVASQLPELPAENLLVEPSGRGTAPCLGWAAVEVARRGGPDAVAIALPADQLVQDPDALLAALRVGADAAERTGSLVTLGITPTRPETGFGYLELGEALGEALGGPRPSRVARFVEKPDAATAARYLAGGRHLWNAGIFLFRADAMLAAFRRHLPRSAEVLDAVARQPELIRARWTELDATSIDFGVMERHGDTLVVPCAPGWSDVGAWPEAANTWPELDGGRGLVAGLVSRDASDNAVYAPGKVVGLLGVSGLVVVQTEDALLVMDAARAQELRHLVDALEREGFGRVL